MQFIVTTHFTTDAESLAFRVSAADPIEAENLVWEYFIDPAVEATISEQETRKATVPLSLEDANIPKLPGN